MRRRIGPGPASAMRLVPKKANLKEQFEKAEPKHVTTLMLRNVPNAYDRERLVKDLTSGEKWSWT